MSEKHLREALAKCRYANDVLTVANIERLLDRDEMTEMAVENERLRLENWQLKGALGYEVPGHIPPSNEFKCGLCEARVAKMVTRPGEDIIEATRRLVPNA